MKSLLSTLLEWIYRAALGVVVIYLVLLAISGAMLRSAYRALEQAGRPMHRYDVIPPAIEDYNNAAMLLGSATFRLKAESVVLERHHQWQSGFFLAPPEGSQTNTLLRALSQLAADRQREDGEFFEAPDRRFRSLIVLPEVEQSMALLKEGSLRSACRLAGDDEGGQDILVTVVSYSDLLSASRILMGRASVRASNGDAAGAWDDLITGLRISTLLSEEPMLLPLLIRLAMVSLMTSSMPEVAAAGMPDADTFRQLDELLVRVQRIDLARALDGTRILEGEAIYQNPQSYADHLDVGPWSLMSAGRAPLRQMDHAAYLRNMLELSESVHEPLAAWNVSTNSSDDTPAPWYAIVARVATPSGTDLNAEVAIARARARMARTFLAIMRHHEQTGQFPPQIPISGDEFEDPFTDERFIYRPTAEGFLLYSVGPDQVDNDGEPFPSRTRKGDLVWRYPPGE
jgi:hypothetical protein